MTNFSVNLKKSFSNYQDQDFLRKIATQIQNRLSADPQFKFYRAFVLQNTIHVSRSLVSSVDITSGSMNMADVINQTSLSELMGINENSEDQPSLEERIQLEYPLHAEYSKATQQQELPEDLDRLGPLVRDAVKHALKRNSFLKH